MEQVRIVVLRRRVQVERCETLLDVLGGDRPVFNHRTVIERFIYLWWRWRRRTPWLVGVALGCHPRVMKRVAFLGLLAAEKHMDYDFALITLRADRHCFIQPV